MSAIRQWRRKRKQDKEERRKKKEERKKKSLKYAIETGDWSHWSGTELALAYVMTPYIGNPDDRQAMRKELDRRGIRR